jgi:hypothetical protein
MSIEYSLKIRQTDKAKIGDLPGVITHVHFDYVGESADGKIVRCESVLPFQVKELIFETADGPKTLPSVLDPDNFTPEPTEGLLVSWLEQNVPAETLSKFRSYISERIAQMES